MRRNCDASVGECGDFGRLVPNSTTKNSRLERYQADPDPHFLPDTAVYGSRRRTRRDYHEQVTTQTQSSPPLYFNHGGCSFTTSSTLDAVVRQLRLEQALGNSVADLTTSADRSHVYTLAARALGADATNIALTDSHTTGWAKALQTISLNAGDVILTSRSEWGGNLSALQKSAQRHGSSVVVMPTIADGSVCLKSLAALMTKSVKLISVSWIGSNGGHVEPVAEIGQIARAYGVTYFVDASQVVGQMPVDVKQIGCDVLTTPGRKWLRGPKGTGFMYLRSEYLHKCQATAQADGAADSSTPLKPKHFEASSASVPLQMGLLAALGQLEQAGVEAVQKQILTRSQYLWEGLQGIPGVHCICRAAPMHGLVSFTVEGHPTTAVRQKLMDMGIEVAANQAAFTPLDMHARQLDAVVRASPHACTTTDEIDQLIEAVKVISQQHG
ncbi:aminotransferase class V-fold PLP-dependent enzyme [Limnohabitans sp.]|nr:aminotransferase class V-fold PLP-dependent enzyme [Limnohabitans sp.]